MEPQRNKHTEAHSSYRENVEKWVQSATHLNRLIGTGTVAFAGAGINTITGLSEDAANVATILTDQLVHSFSGEQEGQREQIEFGAPEQQDEQQAPEFEQHGEVEAGGEELVFEQPQADYQGIQDEQVYMPQAQEAQQPPQQEPSQQQPVEPQGNGLEMDFAQGERSAPQASREEPPERPKTKTQIELEKRRESLLRLNGITSDEAQQMLRQPNEASVRSNDFRQGNGVSGNVSNYGSFDQTRDQLAIRQQNGTALEQFSTATADTLESMTAVILMNIRRLSAIERVLDEGNS